jgi:hypothetical protein
MALTTRDTGIVCAVGWLLAGSGEPMSVVITHPEEGMRSSAFRLTSWAA